LGNDLVGRREGAIHAEKIPAGVWLPEGPTFLNQMEV
jgi:hypothetical protein